MGNNPSTGAIPYNFQNFEMVMAPSTQYNRETDDKNDMSVFNIFRGLRRDEYEVIAKPLTDAPTKDYYPNFQIAVSSMQALNTSKEHELEDFIFVKDFEMDGEKLFLASVLDGHMGLDILEMVVENLFDLLVDRLFHYPENIPQEITTVFREVDSLCCEEKARQLFQILRSRKSCFPCLPTKKLDNPGNLNLGSGCVLSFLCIQNNQLILVGLGDCGICFSIGGKAEYILPTHSVKNKLEEQRIKIAGAYIEDNRVNGMLGVTRSFGDIWFKSSYHDKKNEGNREQDIVIPDPVVAIHPLSSDVEFCIIGSDGLFSVIEYQVAVNCVKKTILSGRSGEDACKELIERCRQKTKDDITVMILFFHISEHKKSYEYIDEKILQETHLYSDGEDGASDSIHLEEYSIPHSQSEIDLVNRPCRDSLCVSLATDKA